MDFELKSAQSDILSFQTSYYGRTGKLKMFLSSFHGRNVRQPKMKFDILKTDFKKFVE